MFETVDAMVLCAGLGTRLRPLTLEVAKPAVPLVNRPLVGYALDRLVSSEFSSVTINTHWLPETMAEATASEARRLGLALSVSHEPVVLGTGGALWQARERGLIRRDRSVLILNGDVVYELDLPRAVRTHVESDAAATMVLRAMPAGATYSPVEADESGKIRRIAKWGEPGHGPARLFSGVHLLSPRALDLLPAGESGVIEQVYVKLLAQGERIQAVIDDAAWLDLGDVPGYLDAHAALLAGNMRFSTPPPIHAEAVIGADASLVRTTVGAGAKVGQGATLVDCVVWAGAEVKDGELLERTVVTPKTRAYAPR